MNGHPLSGLFGASSPQTEVEEVVPQPTEPTENIYYEIPLGMVEKLLANPYNGLTHPDYHLTYVDEIYGLFKLSSIIIRLYCIMFFYYYL